MDDHAELIITHARADFDAFASMLLAARLFPRAMPILPGTTIYRLREVLSLYRDIADFRNIGFLRKRKKTAIRRIIVVDTKKQSQLREFTPWLDQAEDIRIFDHHPPTSDDLTRCALEQYPYGANATGLYFKLTESRLSLSAQEATIVLLGIYADTGNLTYPGTTARDALAVSRLLDVGADLSIVTHYLRPFFDPAQRLVLRDLLADLQEFDMEGYKVILVKKKLEAVLQGVSDLVSQISDMTGADAILGVFSSRDKPGVQIVIQSLVPEIDAAQLAQHFDGGGHPGASSAFLPRADMDGVADTLMTLLTEVPLPLTKVRDVMTTDLVILNPNMSIADAAGCLDQAGIHGAPVLDDYNAFVGVFSLRDAEKARLHNLMHAPVSAFMSHMKIKTITPDTPLVQAKKIISSHDIGRLPVIDGDRIVGIISRSDILNGQKEVRPL
jgi:tRNA nucleotidyltransferase (CCA-adding enzyme)